MHGGGPCQQFIGIVPQIDIDADRPEPHHPDGHLPAIGMPDGAPF